MKLQFNIKTILLIFLFLLCGLLFSQKINLVTADLGRHIKNGEEITKGNFWPVVRTNFYSYSNPDFPFVNHHWLSGVIFYFFQRYFGFVGVSILFVLLNLMTFGFVFDIAKDKAGLFKAVIFSLLLLPVISFRTEVRPEIFSYLFTAIFWWILYKFGTGSLDKKWLWLLPAIMILWVNLHVYFFMGFFLLGIFILDFFLEKKIKIVKNLLSVAFFSGVVCLLNPHGFKGLLYPLNIFKDYGYRLFENQTVRYIDRFTGGNYPPNLFFKIAFAIFAISFIYAVVLKKKVNLVDLIIGIFISYISFRAIRNFTLFGFMVLPIISANFVSARSLLAGMNKDNDGDNVREMFIFSTLSILIVFVLFIVSSKYWLQRNYGWGLIKGVNDGAEFFLKNNLKGPIFNDYDIGSYLIYHLFPKEEVFVDNRPEAYTEEFFKDVYIPMQADDKNWPQILEKYKFNTIFFNRNDLTEWAQNFLSNRLKDKEWELVYIDKYCVIFIRS